MIRFLFRLWDGFWAWYWRKHDQHIHERTARAIANLDKDISEAKRILDSMTPDRPLVEKLSEEAERPWFPWMPYHDAEEREFREAQNG